MSLLDRSPTANPTFFRTYSRRKQSGRESFKEVQTRCVDGLSKLGKFTAQEQELVNKMMGQLKVLPSGRWMWIGGTPWSENAKNFPSAYNCTSRNIVDWKEFALMMELGMMGCGTGGVLEEKYIKNLPPIINLIKVEVIGKPGTHLVRIEDTDIKRTEGEDSLDVFITVGDSRQGWVKSMVTLLELAAESLHSGLNKINVTIDVSSIRPDGSPIKGFGGVANPVELISMYVRVANVLKRYFGKTLDYEGVCLLLDEVAKAIVAGNVRRYAGMRQFNSFAELLKQNLWRQDSEGKWSIDPSRDALRMSNHTRVFHHKPSKEECIEAVRSQYYSGEGAIQWAGEAIARSSADLLDTKERKKEFIEIYIADQKRAAMYLAELLIKKRGLEMTSELVKSLADELEHRLERYALNPCGE